MNSKVVRVTPTMALAVLHLDKPEQEQIVQEPVNWIWIYDRSGSMYSTLPGLIEDMVAQVEKLPAKDTLTLGWFSTEGGKFNWVFKGLSLANKPAIIQAMHQNNTTIGLTCFSEIMSSAADQVIPDLSVLPGTFGLMFFTDGYPVVNNYKREVDTVMSALERIGKKVSSAMLIGYGAYYNKSLMAQMTERVGGTLVHSSRLADFTESMSNFIGQPVAPRVAVALGNVYNSGTTFSVENGIITQFPVENGVAMVPENVSKLYVAYQDGKTSGVDTVTGDEEAIKGILGLCAIKLGAQQADEALELAGRIGEVALIDEINNAQTNDEFGKATNKVVQAFDPARRFTKGQNLNYLPDPNAFCLVDALNVLADDDEARFFPDDPHFVYKRTGIPTHQKSGFPKFTPSPFEGCKFTDLVWNSKRLNLGILARKVGTVALLGEYWTVGLKPNVESFIFRNYVLVKDGVLNVEVLPATMSELTFRTLKNAGMITDKEWFSEGIYDIHLDAVPIVNRRLAEAPTSAVYCSWLEHELKLEYTLKYLKWYLNKVDPEGVLTKEETPWTTDQEVFLKAQGVTVKGFQPDVEKGEATDFYYAKQFEVKIAKFSSAPKIEDVVDKVRVGKTLTPSEQLMSDIMPLLSNNIKAGVAGGEELAVTIKRNIDYYKSELNTIRRKIQGTRFAILLAKKWFPDLTTRDGAVVNQNGYQFTFSIQDVKVEY